MLPRVTHRDIGKLSQLLRPYIYHEMTKISAAYYRSLGPFSLGMHGLLIRVGGACPLVLGINRRKDRLSLGSWVHIITWFWDFVFDAR